MITLLEAISPTARQLLDESYRSDEPTKTDDSVSPELPVSESSPVAAETLRRPLTMSERISRQKAIFG